MSIGPLSGDAAATAVSIEDQRSAQLMAQVEGLHLQHRSTAKQTKAALQIQSIARMHIHRRRYRIYRHELGLQVAFIRERRQRQAVHCIQRFVRGFFGRKALRKLKAEWLQAWQDSAGKKGKGAGKGAKGAAAVVTAATYDTLQSNANFVNGVKAYMLNRFDDALQLFDTQNKMLSDPVVLRMIENTKKRQQGLPVVKININANAQAAAAAVGASAVGKKPPEAKKKK
jgi:hypothetical protein